VLSQTAGSLQFLANGAWTKRSQVGWAAVNGLMAATLVREGFKGASEALEGKHGFMNAYAPNPKPERAVQDLGAVFELMNTAVKPYPSCRYGHAASTRRWRCVRQTICSPLTLPRSVWACRVQACC
jgi:2-methylcitrate dehydratase PrpD